jgi:hypothetical protein
MHVCHMVQKTDDVLEPSSLNWSARSSCFSLSHAHVCHMVQQIDDLLRPSSVS